MTWLAGTGRRRRRSLLAAVLAGAWLLPADARGDGDELAEILARPVSPGTLALLIPHAADARAPTYWRDALAHEKARVRGTAARLLLLGNVVAAVPALDAALAREDDPEAAFEEVSALLILAGTAADQAALEAARRFPPERFAVAIAEQRGQAALPLLDQLLALKLSSVAQRRVVSGIAAGEADPLNRMAGMAVDAADAALWQAALDVAQEDDLAVDPVLVERALRSESARIRALAWWKVAILAAAGGTVPDAMRTLLTEPPDLGELSPEMAFGREVASRALGSDPAERADVLGRARDRGADFDLPWFGLTALSGPLERLLTPAEVKAFEITTAARDAPRQPHEGSETHENDFRVIRTVGPLPAGYVADVLRQTGCDPGNSPFVGGMVVRYSPTRTILELQPIATALSEECDTAARLITAAGLPPVPRGFVPGRRELVVLPLHDTFLDCLARDARPKEPVGQRERRQYRKFVLPKKVRHLQPVYPPKARRERKEGIVIVEGTISETGCVQRAEVVKGLALGLDLSALRAVTGWAFEPARLDGVPTRVTVTVAVKFDLR